MKKRFVLCILVLIFFITGFPGVGEAAFVTQNCSTNPTLVLGVDFNTNDDLTLSGGGTCTITLDQDEAGVDATISLNSLTITENTTLTHAVSGTTAAHHNELDLVVTGNVTVDAGSEINVTGKGYLGAFAGANSSQYGRTAGNTVTGGSFFRISGSHGGKSGKTGAFQIADSYDSIVNPVLPGGGGSAADSGFTGGTGGGVVRISATNIDVSGNIIANGGNGSQTGGAGGTVYLNASGTLSGAGSITANGGGATGTSYTGGGGGRIALLYGDSTHSGSVTAYGYQSDGALEDGSAGTIFRKDSADTSGYLTIDNNAYPDANFATEIDSTNDVAFDGVTVTDYGRLMIESTAVSFETDMLQVDTNAVFESDINHTFSAVDTTSLYPNGGRLQFDGNLDLTTFDTTSGDETGTLVTSGYTYVSSGTVVLGPNLLWEANGAIKQNADTNLGTFTIEGTDSGGDTGGILSHSKNSTSDTFDLNFTVGTLTIESGVISDGSIDVSGKGYLGGYARPDYYISGVYTTDINSSQTGRTNGNTTVGGSVFRSSGSHGGRSGKTGTYVIGDSYGSIVSPVLPGSGGGGPDSSSIGGNGGGVISITATNIVVNGDILANGGSGHSTGGSGGSILLDVSGTISGTGSITASGAIPSTSIFTGGGGGRISILFGTYSHSGTLLAAGGNSDGADEDGAAGTIYKKEASQTYGELIIDNNGAAAAYYATTLLSTIPAADQLFSSGYGVNTTTVSNYGVLNIPSPVDSSASDDAGVTELFHSNACTVDDDSVLNGEITYNNATVSGATASQYTCFGMNTPPSISESMTVEQQQSDGFVHITYALTDIDTENDISLEAYEYSLDNAVWSSMTIADDEAHEGIINLTGDTDGVDHVFVWDACADISVFDENVFVRFTPNDGTDAGDSVTVDTPFQVDCAVPVVSNVVVSQNSASSSVQVLYDVSDDTNTNLLIELDISEDGGATWNVTDTSVSGDIGSGQVAGVENSFVWNAGIDFDGQEQTDLRIRVRATDAFQNVGDTSSSANFSLDTLDPSNLADLTVVGGINRVHVSWTASTDTHFDQYEIWYGTDQVSVGNRTATEWDSTDDDNLLLATTTSTTILGLSSGTTYYFKLWAIDDFGNESTLATASTQTESAGITLTESGGTTVISEAGDTDTYTLVLDTIPESSVTVAVTPASDMTVSTSSITFTSDNWDTPVTVTVTAVNDDVDEGDHTATITHEVSSLDAQYSDIDIDAVLVSITDNDTAGVTRTGLGDTTAVTEGGVTDTFTLVLDSAPTSTVTITLTSNEEVTVSTNTIRFTSISWNVPVTVTVTAVNDGDVEGDHTGTIQFSVASDTDENYDGFVVASVTVIITDNDTVQEDTDEDSESSDTGGGTAPSVPAPIPAPTVMGNEPKIQSFLLSSNTPISISLRRGGTHSVTLEGVATPTRIVLLIQSNPIQVALEAGVQRQVDITSDGIPDIALFYRGLVSGKPKIDIQDISQITELMTIESGAETTDTREVNISFFVQGATLVALSEHPSFFGSSFVPYQSVLPWTLSLSSGSKTVYARFRSPEGGIIESQDMITFIPPHKENLPISVAPSTPVSSRDHQVLFTRFLTLGSVGTDVRLLQQILQDHGFMPVAPVTNVFGVRTKAAVVTFQASRGIEPVGYVGPATRAALHDLMSSSSISSPIQTLDGVSAVNRIPVVFRRFLGIGSVGDDVRQLQELLQSKGFMEKNPTTHYFGPRTRAGVVAFQRSHGIDPVGYVGPATRKVLHDQVK
ncbi:MAG: peptidoglycan-binding protein [Candidatus Magasanikbacteria bacterium]|nr:peptidoglycan-binding protein [Candidatus Magasanikbacteria bacterium]